MRVKHSILNIVAGLGSQIIITILSFFSRTVFINALGIDYLGVNGLFTSILAMLSLAEAGIGSSIIYSLYKPVAEQDVQKINMLMKLYRKAYLIIAMIIFALGMLVMPFLPMIVKGAEVDHLYWIYLIFLFNTVLPYFFQYKMSFLSVNQKGYIITSIFSISSIATLLLRIAILQVTSNYILYLSIDILITLINSLIVISIVNRKYPYLSQKSKESLDVDTRQSIVRNIRSILLQNIGNYLIFGTDNIIISSFVSVAAVGLYSNYNMLIEIARTFINQVFNNIYHSVGNLVAKESTEKVYEVFKVYWLVNFWLYSLFSILLYTLTEPFIGLWLGSDYLMSQGVLIVIVVVFFERGMRNCITTIKTTAGIFHQDRYAPLVQAVVNLVFSILLVKMWGIVGVFVGTLLSALAVPIWLTPYLVYKNVFHMPLRKYFNTYSIYILIGVLTAWLTEYVCGYLPINSYLELFLTACVAFAIPNVVFMVLFGRTKEFKYLLAIVQQLVGKLGGRLLKKGLSS